MADAKIEITVKNADQLIAAIIKALQVMDEKEVLVGIPQSADDRANETFGNAEIGMIAEFGSPAQNIPPWPHLIPGAESRLSEIQEILKESVKAAVKKKDSGEILKGLEKTGLIAQSGVKNYVVSQEGAPPLSEATIKKRQAKGATGTKRLIRTGEYVNSITYAVADKESE